jgi:PAS domain S-box-containing protein
MSVIRLLLIDDDESQYTFVRDMLDLVAADGYQVLWSSTYADGLRRLADGAIDVALVDNRLGASSGLELIRAAAGSVRGDIPLIMLTGFGDRGLDLQAMDSGAADYLSKADLTPELLDRTIRYALRHSHAVHRLRESEEQLRALVAEQRLAQSALAESEGEYRSMFDASPVGLAHADLEGRWIRVNRRLREMLGYPQDGEDARDLPPLAHLDVLAAPDARDALLRGARERLETERPYRRPDGGQLWARAHIQLHRDAAGAPRYFIAAFEDVSARKSAEEELHRALRQLQAVVSSLPMTVWALDSRGIITFSEGRLLARFGLKPGETIGQSQLELYRDNPEVLDATRRALAGDQLHLTLAVHDGIFETWYTPLRADDGVLAGTIGVAVEITDRLRLEEQFRQAQKMEAVGRLAGGVAHDFNNLLTAIIGYGELAISALPEGSEVRADVEEMYKAGQSAAGLTRQLLAFSRSQMLQPQGLVLNDVVTRMDSLLRRVIGEDVVLETQLGAGVHPVYADPSQLEQIVVNLAINARDAMPAGGRLTIETGHVDLDAGHAGRHEGSSPGPHVQLTIADTGTGMSPEIRARIFEPFFTTKERGKGTGLGLATVYGIVRQSGGSIDVETGVGRGTTFRIYLPVAPERAAAAPVPGPMSEEELRGSETILLVEDQEEVRSVARDILQRHGYVVLEAARPSQAIAIGQSSRAIDLLLTDLVLPDMSGRLLAAQLRNARPTIKVVYTSGYTDDRTVLRDVADAGFPFVQKPFTAAALLSKIREVLDSDRLPSSPRHAGRPPS